MVKNKGQMKIQQMAFVLMALTLFFAFAGLFFLSFAFSGVKEHKTRIGEETALSLVVRLANSPEFSCGRVFDNVGISCVDADKIMILKSNYEKYEDFWGDEILNIEVVKLFPIDNTLCTLGNYPNCGVISIFSNREGFYKDNFVSLCRKASSEGKTYDKCDIAKLRIGYRSQE
jgi:hypothetical protein